MNRILERHSNTFALFIALSIITLAVFGFDVDAAVINQHGDLFGAAGLAFAGCGSVGDIHKISEAVDIIENKINKFHDQAEKQLQETGKVSTETKNALEKFQEKQLEIADRLLYLEQKGVSGGGMGGDTPRQSGWGSQIVKNQNLKELLSGSRQKIRVEVQNNTLTGSDTTAAPMRKPGVVAGGFAPLTLESLFPHFPTTEAAIEFTRENVFTNSAAEAAEGAQKAESAITWTLVNQPVSTVAHWLKISKQLAADNQLLAAYVNARLSFGVNRRVETQLAAGDGTGANIGGILKSGNHVVHAYDDATLGSGLKKHKLIRRIIADMKSGGFMPSAVLMNPADWLLFDLDLLDSVPATITAQDIAGGFEPRIFGVPVVESIGVTADSFAVIAPQLGVIHDRQAVEVEISDSDGDNFTKNLLTIRAERRLAFCVEQPAAARGGDLSPV
ncbi:phage major capsid protein [Methylicorpusculum oleiharenae]|uniref:phage major capsid protein n=1 Tax=Methylicorpusculum oleiharenae TaxID=1338687 RepID=UPI00135B577A|nr:phage major capsid protein [Methylicorpusculum oleiharenae]MCD2451650.1 phage major capsid protein [Methylicorpusculum oleiharenae]